MKILAFESSARAAGVALLSGGALLAEYTQNSGQTHSRTLMQMAEDMLRNCDITAQDIDAVAVAAGPGSFTGVRIGVAAAKGFAWGRQLPLYGVSTLEAMALGAAVSDGVYCACMDARREQVYTASVQGCVPTARSPSPSWRRSLRSLMGRFFWWETVRSSALTRCMRAFRSCGFCPSICASREPRAWRLQRSA